MLTSYSSINHLEESANYLFFVYMSSQIYFPQMARVSVPPVQCPSALKPYTKVLLLQYRIFHLYIFFTTLIGFPQGAYFSLLSVLKDMSSRKLRVLEILQTFILCGWNSTLMCVLELWPRARFHYNFCLQFCITHAPRQRKQLPLRRLNIMENKPFSLRSRPFLGRWSPSNGCLTTPLYKLVLSFCPLIRDIPSSEVLKD